MVIHKTEEFGQIIKTRRKKLGYTQRQLSEMLGISMSFISQLENGKATAEIGKCIFVAKNLGLDISVNERGSNVVN